MFPSLLYLIFAQTLVVAPVKLEKLPTISSPRIQDIILTQLNQDRPEYIHAIKKRSNRCNRSREDQLHYTLTGVDRNSFQIRASRYHCPQQRLDDTLFIFCEHCINNRSRFKKQLKELHRDLFELITDEYNEQLAEKIEPSENSSPVEKIISTENSTPPEIKNNDHTTENPGFSNDLKALQNVWNHLLALNGQKVDLNKVKELLRNSGNPLLQTLYGDLLFSGHDGFKKDKKRGERLCKQGLNQLNRLVKSGDQAGLTLKGLLYQHGCGVTKNSGEALHLYKKAGHHPVALGQLGTLYFYGNGTVKNRQKGYQYFKKASKLGNTDACGWVGYYHKKVSGYKDQKKAFQWFQKCALRGDLYSLNETGMAYYYGHGVTKNHPRAFGYFQSAAGKGYASSQSWIAYCYQYGKGVSRDLSRAKKWYQIAAKNGNTFSMTALGEIYLKERRDREAFQYFLQGARKNDKNGLYWIGYCYDYGRGVSKNRVKAKKWYQKAAKKGHKKAKRRLKKI